MKVMLTRAHSLSSFAIRARLSMVRSRRELWSHALVVLDNGNIIDSTFKAGGVRLRAFAAATGHASRARLIDIPLRNEKAAIEWLHSQVGKPYDWRACWGLATGDREWRDEFAWFCFELVAGAAMVGGREVETDASLITAGDLLELADD